MMSNVNIFKRTIPLAIAFIVTIALILNYYTNLSIDPAENALLSWSVVITTAALGLGVINLVQRHAILLSEQKKGWPFSALLLASMALTIGIGLLFGGESVEFSTLYNATLAPLGATLMSIFIVWIAPAFARYLVPRNATSAILVGTILICMVAGGPLGQSIYPPIANVNQWILSVGAMGAQRGLKITIGLGMILISLRIITGREKSFMKEEVS